MSGLFGALRTSVSGMNAQSSRIGAVSDNVANASTTGYKRASVEFETVLGNTSRTAYYSGGVAAHTRTHISEQGMFQSTGRETDIAISGNGQFVVTDSAGQKHLTRAGSFTMSSDGRLVNVAGFDLMGFDLKTGSDTPATIQIDQTGLVATPSSDAKLGVNLDSSAATVAAGDLPSANAATSTWSSKTTMIAYDNLGGAVKLDVYFSKTAAGQWEAAIFDSAAAGVGGGFPYSSGPLTTQTLSFDPANGQLLAGSPVSVAIPNGQTLNIDLAGSTQLAADFTISSQTINGHAPSSFDHLEIDTTGTIAAVYSNGARVDLYQIALGTVTSVDNLSSVNGNAYVENSSSGPFIIGRAMEGGMGSVKSGSLEASTTDIASELVSMIEAQRGYTANSKTFQTASEMMDVLIAMKS